MAFILQVVFFGSWMYGKKKIALLMHKPNKDLAYINELFETGKVVPVIDRCYPLSETADALRYFGKGQFQGKVVITVKEE